MQRGNLKKTLGEPGFWPRDGPVEVIETHISWVFLVGDRAYKLKKPVDFGFVDFTTLEQRRFYCEEELRLNRRLAPDLYLGLRTISGTPEKPQLGENGEPIDYVVEMTRFDQDALLANAEPAGKLGANHMESLAEIVADFHRRATAAGPDSAFGSPDAIARPVEENFRHLLADRSPEETGTLTRLRDWARDEHHRLEPVFEARQSGKIRECHGDLHLGNMILKGDTITVFDCIEFNEELRWIDVLSDVAFCAMDLASRGRDDLAYGFLNRYLEQTGDYQGLPVLPYYLSYRATVRAKIAWLRLRESSGDGKAEAEKEHADYLALAEAYAFRRQPELFIMHGVSGTGKSFGSREIVKATGAIRIRSDLERKRIARETGARELYTPEMTRRTYDLIHDAAEKGLQAGFSIILDATYLREKERAAARGIAGKLGLPCHILHPTADEQTLRERIRRRREQKNDPSDATTDVLRQQLATREPLTEAERRITLDIDTNQSDCWTTMIARIEGMPANASTDADGQPGW